MAVEKVMYRGLVGLSVKGENYKRNETLRQWLAKSTGGVHHSKYGEILIEVVEEKEGRKQRRWLNLQSFTGNVGPYRFDRGERIDHEKSPDPF